MQTDINAINEIDAIASYNNIKKIENTIKETEEKLAAAKKKQSEANDNASELDRKEDEYNREKAYHDRLIQRREIISRCISEYHSLRSTWSEVAEDACKKAALLNLKVTISAAGINVEQVTVCGGIYSDFSYSSSQQPVITGTFKFNGDIANDFRKRILKIFPAWLTMAKAFWRVWEETDKLYKPNYDTTCEDVSRALNTDITKQEEKLKVLGSELTKLKNKDFGNPRLSIESLSKDLNNLKEDLKKEQGKYNYIYENDPILGILSKLKGHKYYGKEWLDRVKDLAMTRTELRGLQMPGGMLDLRKHKNIFISSPDSPQLRSEYFKALLATYLLAFPVGKINIDIIEKDPAPKLIHDLDRSICKITDYKNNQGVSEVINRIKQYYIELEGINNGQIPTQLTVFYGYDDRSFETIVKDLNDVITNGPTRGLHFIAVGSESFTPAQSSLLKNKFNPVGFHAPDDLFNNNDAIAIITETDSSGKETGKRKESFERWIFNHFKTYAKVTGNKVCPSLADGTFYDRKNRFTEITAPDDDKPKMAVPFGEKTNGSVMNLELSSNAASCAFIVGQTGSGKSYLLHSILSNMMLKYDTTAVELILMDFKTAGVELNYYKDVPHVSHLLVNGNDKQIVQEILKSIKVEMENRGNAFKELGCDEISNYNKKAKSKGLSTYPYMIMAVDECSGLFDSDQGVGMAADEIKKIITTIAKEGRSQGIFMILATQTYHGSGIPRDVIKQFNTFLLMKCSAEDVTDCDINDNDLKNRVGSLKQGEVVMYRKTDNSKAEGKVYDYAGKKEHDDDEMGIYKKKTIEYLRDVNNYSKPGKDPFYFSSNARAYFDEYNKEFSAMRESVEHNKICLIPGRRISTDQMPVVCELKQTHGNNVLILGANGERQAERVLWSSVMSLWGSAMKRDAESQFYIIDNAPDGKPLKELKPVNEISGLKNVTILSDNLRHIGIGEAFADVLLRNVELEKEKAEKDAEMEELSLADLVRKQQSVKSGDRRKFHPIFLVLPNHELFVSQLTKDFKVPKKLKDNPEYSAQQGTSREEATDTKARFGVEIYKPGTSTSAPSPASSQSLRNIVDSIKTYADALGYILKYGPEVGAYVIVQTSDLDKIIPDKNLSGNDLNHLFSEIIMLRMPIAAAERINLGCHRLVIELPADIDRLRALIYSPYASSDNLSYLIPFDFPKEDKIGNLFKKLREF